MKTQRPMDSSERPVTNLSSTKPRNWTAGSAAGYGALVFSGVSLLAFSVWALGGSWFRNRGGEPAMYAAIALVFLGLTGWALSPLLRSQHRIRRFHGFFLPAFLGYAIVWSGFWFWLKFGWGEWLGAAAGCLLFTLVGAWKFNAWDRYWKVSIAFFTLHTIGYFAGGWSMGQLLAVAKQAPIASLDKRQWITLAQLSWGFAYGLGFGAALGYLTYEFQRTLATPETTETSLANHPPTRTPPKA
jgi:hypothetical protein